MKFCVEEILETGEVFIVHKEQRIPIDGKDINKATKALEDVARKRGLSLEQYLDKLVNLIPKIDGKFWKAINNSGTELRWINQTDSNKLGIRLSQLIDNAVASMKPAVAFEGKVAKFVESLEDQLGKIDNFSNKVINKTKSEIAEFDITTSKYILECKKGLSLKTITRTGRKEEFLNQFLRYTDPKDIYYINFQNKKVILVIDEFTDGLKRSHPIFREIEDMGVIILTDYKQLKNIK